MYSQGPGRKSVFKKSRGKSNSLRLTEGQFDFKDLEAHAVADQLTVMEWSLFNKMSDFELFHLRWRDEDGRSIAPNVFALTERSNTVSYWVATEIVMASELKERTLLLKKFIHIADVLA